MNKNIIIGVLIVIFVLGGGYLLLRNSPDTTLPPVTTDTNTGNPVTTNSNPPVDNVPALVLGAPDILTNSNVLTYVSTANVSGQVTPKGTQTTYWFEYGKTDNLGSKTTVQTIGSGFYPISATGYITGLTSNTTYYFRLSAKNNFGTVVGTTYSFTTNSDPAPRAAVPTARTGSASSITRTTANLNGQVNPNGWETTYWFEYGKDANLGSISLLKIISDTSALTTNTGIVGTLAGLDPATKYYFRLNAQNQFGTVNGITQSFTTSGPKK